jgi:hypothetical protein
MLEFLHRCVHFLRAREDFQANTKGQQNQAQSKRILYKGTLDKHGFLGNFGLQQPDSAFEWDKENGGPSNDRDLMPPPRTRLLNPSLHRHSAFSPKAGDIDAQSMASSSSHFSKYSGLPDAEQMRRAQRFADQVQVDPASGFWFKSEEGLLHHLGRRGLEPLLPAAWMVDFKTFPYELFNHDPEEFPLVTHMYEKQFRAIRALRDLIEVGHNVRDQVQARSKQIKIQHTVAKALSDYINWALADAGLYATSDTTPTHYILRRAPKQPVIEAVTKLATRMHGLLTTHRQFFPPDTAGLPSHSSELEPQVQDDSNGQMPPVIVGFLIYGPTASIFTLNARNADAAAAEKNPNRGVHLLGRFNFMDDAMDVWNALALAITACHLRMALLAAAKMDTDDEDKGKGARLIHGRVAGYISKGEFDESRKRKTVFLDDSGSDGPDGANTGMVKKRRTMVVDVDDPDL